MKGNGQVILRGDKTGGNYTYQILVLNISKNMPMEFNTTNWSKISCFGSE